MTAPEFPVAMESEADTFYHATYAAAEKFDFESEVKADINARHAAYAHVWAAAFAAGAQSCGCGWADRVTGTYFGVREPGKKSVRQHPEERARHLVELYPGELELMSRPVIQWELVPR